MGASRRALALNFYHDDRNSSITKGTDTLKDPRDAEVSFVNAPYVP